MIITKSEQNVGKIIKFILHGDFDIFGAKEFRREISSITQGKVILDFEDVHYISSAGLREILICLKRFSEMIIVNMEPDVYSIFETTCFNKLTGLTIQVKKIPSQNEFAGNKLPDLSFKDFLARKVATNAEHIVIKTAEESYSWQDIDRCSNIIAQDLRRKKVGPLSHVAICGANSVNWLLTFFAIQKLGAIAILLNFNLSPKEIDALIKYADITHFCHGEMYTNIADVKEVVQCYDIQKTQSFKVRTACELTSLPEVGADSPAVMIFTSGTTGQSKGVLLSAYNILNAAKYNAADQTLTSKDKACVILPFFHIFGLVAGIFANACANTTIYLPKTIHMNDILALISREKCTIFHSVPTMLLAMINNKTFTREKVASLRCSIISGAAASQAQIERFQLEMPRNHFLTSYGLSEMAPVSITAYDDNVENILHTVGKPVKNIRLKINQPNEEGIGEIMVQGFNLMMGYYKLNVEDQAISADGWLYTGDLGKIDAEGYLRLTGRIKEIIIRGGENIYPAEVEAAISQYEDISNVKVIGIPNDFYGEEVCACLTLKSPDFKQEQLLNFLKHRLAKFKIPSHFFAFDTFPLLGSSKIDVATLKQKVMEQLAD